MMIHIQYSDAGITLAVWQVAKQLGCHAALADVIAGLHSCGSTWQEIDSKIGPLISPDYIEELRKDLLYFIYKRAREGQGVRKV